MKKTRLIFFIIIGFLTASPAVAQPDNSTAARADNATLQIRPITKAQTRADADAVKADKEAILKEADILHARGELEKRVSEMEAAKREQDRKITGLNDQYHANDKEIARLQKRLEEQEGAMDEVSGTVRGLAQDTATVLRRSIVSGEKPGRDKQIEPLLSELEFPTLDNIIKMTDLMFDEIASNGKISVTAQKFVDAAGKETNGEVIRIGAFNALYRKNNKVGYLEYSGAKQAFHELIVTPPSDMAKAAKRFAAKKSQGLYLDLSGGAAFRQLTDMPGWYDQLKSGGALMYPLVIVGVLALVLMLERLQVLIREGKNTEGLADRITSVLQNKNWNEALRLCKETKGSLAQIIEAGIAHRHERAEVLESVLQEAIQSVLPRLERSMSALQILGMVAPLLGLLGTVTGMIATFQMITLYGTGDPKIMSGGISEALITTQYGLIVAIPIILVHGYFQGRIDRIVGLLEEKGMMLVNAVKKDVKEVQA